MFAYQFHKKFDLPLGDKNVLDAEAKRFRVEFLAEEVRELKEALDNQDLVGAFDALLDLVYVAEGTALYLGIDPFQWHYGRHAVHNANMEKVRASSAEDSKRGTALDVVKPEGWVGPESRLREILDWGVNGPGELS